MLTDAGELQIGARLKDLREQRGLSLRELARRTGIAASFLSALERDQNSVSVGKLKTVLDALGSSLGAFFGRAPGAPQQVVYRAEERVEIAGAGDGISYREVTAGRPGRALQLLVERYQPGADTGEDLLRHQAEEAGVVLRGELELTVDGQVHRLGPGDAYYFDSRLPHRFRALGAEPVEAVSVNSPPSF